MRVLGQAKHRHQQHQIAEPQREHPAQCAAFEPKQKGYRASEENGKYKTGSDGINYREVQVNRGEMKRRERFPEIICPDVKGLCRSLEKVKVVRGNWR